MWKNTNGIWLTVFDAATVQEGGQYPHTAHDQWPKHRHKDGLADRTRKLRDHEEGRRREKCAQVGAENQRVTSITNDQDARHEKKNLRLLGAFSPYSLCQAARDPQLERVPRRHPNL